MQLLQHLFISLGFFTRIPLPMQAGTTTLAQSAWSFPIAGALIGALTGGVYLLLTAYLPPALAAWLAIAFHILLTGGLHEDGLADSADGLASGRNRDEKLAILRDSRIGTYGVLALLVVIMIRAQAISIFPLETHTLLAFIAIGALSRAGLAALMYAMPQARAQGLAASAGKPPRLGLAIALMFAITACLPLGIHAMTIALVTAILINSLIARIAQKHFGGITGDVLGCAQQLTEAGLLVVIAALWR